MTRSADDRLVSAGAAGARSVHITVGVLLVTLLLGRVIWRATGGRRLKLADTGIFNIVAEGTHWSLYVLPAAMVPTGMFLT